MIFFQIQKRENSNGGIEHDNRRTTHQPLIRRNVNQVVSVMFEAEPDQYTINTDQYIIEPIMRDIKQGQVLSNSSPAKFDGSFQFRCKYSNVLWQNFSHSDKISAKKTSHY